MSRTPVVPDSIEAQAERWFVRMRSDRRQPVDEFMFRQWLAASVDHEAAYQTLVEWWEDTGEFGQNPELRELSRAARDQAEAMSPSPAAAPAPGRAARRRGWQLAAACVGIAALGLAWVANPTVYQARYQTGIGAQHSVRLFDGSRITLNTDTAVQVRYDLRQRQVVLDKGQAHFEVSRSRWWPFEVDAGSGAVRALGTAFDVYRRGAEVRVTLVEGRVQVYRPLHVTASALATAAEPTAPPQAPAQVPGQAPAGAVLHPGQQVSVSAGGLSAISAVSMPKATAWLSGRLVFDDERLADVVNEVNRYSPTRLVVEDPALAEVRVSGVFRAGRAEGFVMTLRASFPVDARRRDDGSLLLLLDADAPIPQRITAPVLDADGDSGLHLS